MSSRLSADDTSMQIGCEMNFKFKVTLSDKDEVGDVIRISAPRLLPIKMQYETIGHGLHVSLSLR